MSAEPETVNVDQVLNQQRNDLDKAIEVLESFKENLNPSWSKENIDATIQMLKDKRVNY